MRQLLLTTLVLTVPVLLPAQGTATLRGVVWDSVSNRPLSAAKVELVDVANPSAPVLRAASDSAGRFELREVRPGGYLGSFSHPLLDSLGIEPPERAVQVGAPTTQVTFATPSASRLARALCGAGSDSTAAIAGVLVDAATQRPIGGEIVVRWPELVIGAGGMRQRVRVARVASDSLSGRYLMCGIPANIEIAVHGERGRDSTGLVPVQLGDSRLVRRTLLLGSAAGESTAELEGTVRNERGQGVSGARVELVGSTAATVADSAGRFTFRRLPLGTRTVAFRALGYAPESRVLDLLPANRQAVSVELTSLKTVLDTMRVTAERVYRDIGNGFDRRRRALSGHFFDDRDVERLRPARLSDLFSRIPSVRVDDMGGGALGIRMRGDALACAPNVFLDGMRLQLELQDLNSLVLPSDIGAIEVYTKEMSPPQFTTLNECGSIVVWTRSRVPTPKR